MASGIVNDKISRVATATHDYTLSTATTTWVNTGHSFTFPSTGYYLVCVTVQGRFNPTANYNVMVNVGEPSASTTNAAWMENAIFPQIGSTWLSHNYWFFMIVEESTTKTRNIWIQTSKTGTYRLNTQFVRLL